MSSVEGSDRGEDSLSQELELVLKNNKIQKNRHYGRNSKNINSQDSLYKEALKEYMFGKFDLASESCKKMIANNPQNPQPYFLMATMHQQAAQRNNDQSELHKSVQYFFFHAYYSSPSVDKWIKVADMSYELQLYMQAAYCYGRALKMNKANLQISLKRAQCLQMCFQIKKAVSIYKRIIQKISNSAEVYKRYAKLRFRRQQYSKARQILFSYPNFQEDLNIKFMIAETFLRQKQFIQLYKFITHYIIQSANPPITNIFEQLQIQFIQMLFICVVNCPNQTSKNINVQDIIQYLKEQYEESESAMYQQIISYIKKLNSQITFKLLQFLLKYESHQTIQNYLYISQFLMKSGKCRQAIKYLQEGLKTEKNMNSVQLKAQLNYLKTLLKTKNKPNLKINHVSKNINKEQQIFYSDDEDGNKSQQSFNFNHLKDKYNEDSLFDDKQSQIQKTKKIKKKKNIKSKEQIRQLQVKDPQIIGKLIQNNQTNLNAMKNEIQNLREENQNQNLQNYINKKFTQVKDCLKYLIQIQGSNRQTSNFQVFQNSKASHSIFNSKQLKKRRTILGKKCRRLNLITKNSSNLIQSLKFIIFFMKEYLKCKKYNQVIDFAQLLSKAHFFKWQNRIQCFKVLKKQVYEMGVLACLQLKKYGKSIFFLRYLINKNPQNQFYLAIAQKIMRLSADKLFINSMVKKGMDWQNQSKGQNLQDKDLIKMYYLTGLQYMQNCFFELAINMFAKVIKILQNQSYNQSQHKLKQEKKQAQNNEQILKKLILQKKQMCKVIYLCISTCFLQMASCRTSFNKLDHINRSIYCFAQYKYYSLNFSQQSQTQIQKQKQIVSYNQARLYSYIKMYTKAIQIYQDMLKNENQCKSQGISEKVALNLMIIYKDIQNYEKIQELSEKYFKIQ